MNDLEEYSCKQRDKGIWEFQVGGEVLTCYGHPLAPQGPDCPSALEIATAYGGKPHTEAWSVFYRRMQDRQRLKATSW